ncbi:MAG: hypothetical protein ACI4K5_01115 [Ruminococcus sp.]
MPKIYLAQAPTDYIKNVSLCPINTTAVYYIIKPKHHLNGDELHIVNCQANGTVFQPRLEGKIIDQYSTTVGNLFNSYSNNLNAIGMNTGSILDDFIGFINQKISSNPASTKVSANTGIWAVEYNINTPSQHQYTFRSSGQLQQVPIIAYI